ncbi:MAG: alpha/beta fold hydrolase [Flavobacteriaceae bacterium]
MRSRLKTPVYLMPGMAASPKIFEFIRLPEKFELIPLSWMPPLAGETLSHYALRMSKRISDPNPVLLGVSFGGILVQEIAKHIPVHKVIVVSSAKSNKELSNSMKIAKTTGAHKLLPTQWIKNLESLSLFVFGPSIKSKVEAYQKYLSERDPAYLDWSINAIVNWNQSEPDSDIIHIHGDKDSVFPIKNIDKRVNFYSIENATHAMILTHHKWFNKNLPNIIANH